MDGPLPPAIVISLADSAERRAACRPQLDAVSGLEWRFLDAIDGRGRGHYPGCYEPWWAERVSGYRLSPSEVGCFMSHRLAWWSCATGSRPVLVCEDDLLLRPSFPAAVRAALQLLDHWDILRLQGFLETPSVPVARRDGTTLVRNLSDPWASTAYVVTPAAARALLGHSRRIVEPVDTFLERRGHGQRLLAVKPYPVTITEVASTMTERPVRHGVRGWKRRRRAVFRIADRIRTVISTAVTAAREPPTCW